MDLGGHDRNVGYLTQRFPHAVVLRSHDYYRSLQRAVRRSRTRYTWVLTSCCDYTAFDFGYVPVPWQSQFLHVWPSGNQQFGDTFLIPTEIWNQRPEMPRLEQHLPVHYQDRSVPRLPWQVVVYEQETVVQALRQADCQTPYVLFTPGGPLPDLRDDPWLWRESPVISYSHGNGVSLVPRAAHSMVRDEIYQYPWLKKDPQLDQEPLDIIFISNGESIAEDNWHHLRASLTFAGHENRLVRVDGVKGRRQAYQAALEQSHTDWAFCVFAKLQVDSLFDWTWQPDRWQRPKHYIFLATNPINGLTYGHQAMIAYNKRLVMENPGTGLDFTLDQPHAVVPIHSGRAYYNDDAWTTWRTAFREVIKLRASLPDRENQQRIDRWCAEGSGDHAEWSSIGARDALDYYDQVAGEFSELKKSYEWQWLASYALMLHPELFTASTT